jgi:hypothetical protein
MKSMAIDLKFRPVRHLLSEAMAEVVEIAPTAEALVAELNRQHPAKYNVGRNPYASADRLSLVDQGFDYRIGWHSFLVCVDGKASGYINGPIAGIRIEYVCPECQGSGEVTTTIWPDARYSGVCHLTKVSCTRCNSTGRVDERRQIQERKAAP